MSYEFFILISTLAVLWTGYLFLIRKIEFPFPREEDSVVMVEAAARSGQWKWPSDMHREGFRATYMKDVSVILVAIFQKIFRDKKSPYPMAAMQGFMNIISALFIFLIGKFYWGEPIGLFLGLLFIFSYWPWQLAVNMGHINVANTIILAAVYATTLKIGCPFLSPEMIIAGILINFLIFSSASAFKYMPLFFAALFFSKVSPGFGNDELFTKTLSLFGQHLNINLLFIILFLLWLVFSNFFLKKIITLYYNDKLPKIIGKLADLMGRKMTGRGRFDLCHYLQYGKNKLRQINLWLGWIFICFFLLLNLIELKILLSVILGFVVSLLLLTLPNIRRNLSFYWLYVIETQIRKKATFRHWVDYFAKKGVTVGRYYRTGVKLVPKLLARRIPVCLTLFYISSVYILFFGIVTEDFRLLATALFVYIVSLSPIIWSEMTHSHQGGRVYFPSFIGILVFIGFASHHAVQISGFLADNFWFFGLPIIFFVFIWNLRQFLTDILPSRMALTHLLKTLEEKNITEFYTYRTDYNIALIGSINPEIAEKFRIIYIDRIADIKHDGWLIIPPTSNKTALWTTSEMEGGIDFVKDPILNELLETKRIEKIAEKKFKTFGSSPIWIMDNDINNHRALIFKEIGKKDFFRGFAWLLHTSKISNLKNQT